MKNEKFCKWGKWKFFGYVKPWLLWPTLSVAKICLWMVSSDDMTVRLEYRQNINSSLPERNGCHFADTIFNCIFMNEKCCISIWIYWSLFLRAQLTVSQHWFRLWLGAEQATSHYLNQRWPISLTHISGMRVFSFLTDFRVFFVSFL